MRFLTVGPRVAREGNRLIVGEPRRARWLLLGAYRHSVIFDGAARTITIEHRVAWGPTKRRVLSFDHVQAIIYGYRDLNEPYTAGFWADSWDSYDHFTVGLRLTDQSELLLFDFVGEGGWRNESGMPDWAFLPNYLFNWVGTQEQDSRQLAEELSEMVGVPIVTSRQN